MKNSEFKKIFFRSDSFVRSNNIKSKKKKSISILMIFLMIFLSGLPFYLYLVFSGKMFDFEIVKKFFNSSESIVTYRPIVDFKPDKSFIFDSSNSKSKYFKKLFSQKKSKELIYSWIDKNGIKQFSNIRPSLFKNDVIITKAVISKPLRKISHRSFLSSDKIRETSILIKGNRILIPVRFCYNGNEFSTFLLLDTGASTTSIIDDFANKFDIYNYQYSKTKIADGTIIDTKITNFDYIIVGPYKMNNFKTIIIDHQGELELSKGLLGMNFLKNVNYRIDYNRKIIKWF